MYLADEVHPVSLLPHVCLDGLSGEDWFGEPSLDGFHHGDVIPTVLPQDVPSRYAIATQPMQDGCLKTCAQEVVVQYMYLFVQLKCCNHLTFTKLNFRNFTFYIAHAHTKKNKHLMVIAQRHPIAGNSNFQLPNSNAKLRSFKLFNIAQEKELTAKQLNLWSYPPPPILQSSEIK